MIPPILGLPVLVVSGFASLERTILLRLAIRSRTWPRASGYIVAAARDVPVFQDPVARFSPALAYEYTVGDASYTGTRVRFGGYKFLNTARRIGYRYPPSSKVHVAYNPERPDQAVLEPGTTLGDYGTLFGCVGWAVFGVYVAFLQRAS
jgi:uncharacterized protein DUF3592